MKIYIYVLIDPETNKVRYVGKSNEFRIKKRLVEHCRPSTIKYHTHKNFWIKSLLKKNLKPILKIIEETNLKNFRKREKYWVKFYRKIDSGLTNYTEGGEGCARIHNRIITKGQKEQISETLKKMYKREPKRKILCSIAGKRTRGIKRKFKFNQSSEYVGVSYMKKRKKWRAYSFKDGKQIHLGTYSNQKNARDSKLFYDAKENLL